MIPAAIDIDKTDRHNSVDDSKPSIIPRQYD
jgi:hypothetical protein